MSDALKVTKELHKYFQVRRIYNEEESYIECNFKEGCQFLDMQGIERRNISEVSTVVTELKITHPDIQEWFCFQSTNMIICILG